MFSYISNNIKIYNYTDEIYNWITNNLVIDNPDYIQACRMRGKIYAKQMGIPYTSICYKINNSDNSIEIPFGCLNSVWRMIKNYDYTFNFNKTDDISIKDVKCPWDLYEYQEKAVTYMVKQKGGILVSQCGSGKSLMGIEIIHRIGKKFLWLTHTKALLEQTYNVMKKLYPNIDIGTVYEGKCNFGEDGTIATVQSLSRLNPEKYKDMFETVVCDECAHVVGSNDNTREFTTILDNIAARYKYGLTATPSRADTMINTMYMYLGTSKKGFYEPMYEVDKSCVKTIPALHYRVNVDTKIPADKEKQMYKFGKINYNNLINFLAEDDDRNRTILKYVKHYHKEGRTQIILCHRVKHCLFLYKMLTKMGIPAEVIIGNTNAIKRNKIINRDIDWNVLVATYQLLKEGVNITELDTLHLATPQADEATTIQCAGRIERFLEDKKQPIILDYVDVNIGYCVKKAKERLEHLYFNKNN